MQLVLLLIYCTGRSTVPLQSLRENPWPAKQHVWMASIAEMGEATQTNAVNRSYCTKVRHIFIRCLGIIADVNAPTSIRDDQLISY